MKIVLVALWTCLLAADRLSVQLTPVLSDPDKDSTSPVTGESLHDYLYSDWEKSANRTNVNAI